MKKCREKFGERTSSHTKIVSPGDFALVTAGSLGNAEKSRAVVKLPQYSITAAVINNFYELYIVHDTSIVRLSRQQTLH